MDNHGSRRRYTIACEKGEPTAAVERAGETLVGPWAMALVLCILVAFVSIIYWCATR